MELVTVRIPELIKHPGPLSLQDRLPIWYKDINKTRYTELGDIRDLILTGGTGAALPVVQSGDTIIHIVTASEAGGTIVSIPALAGKTFGLRRAGNPLIPQKNTTPLPTDEYQCLSAGGFKVLQPGDILVEGERFELTVYALQGGSISGPSTGGSLITGQVIVTTNFTIIPADHLNKLISIRADNSIITVTLPDVADVPDNTIVPIETTILNNWQVKITTQSGQYIYMRNNNYTSVYMGKSESLWLYRADDGWYDINQFSKNYEGIGIPQPRYKIGLNELLCDGSVLSRAAHPRLWEEVQTYGSSLVSEATWTTPSAIVEGRTVAYPFRGCFSSGNGSTDFRLPNLMGMSLRGVLSTSGSDPGRLYNKPGGFQGQSIGNAEVKTTAWTGNALGKNSLVSDSVGFLATHGDGGSISSDSASGVNRSGARTLKFSLDLPSNSETRMDNVGVLWVIKE